MDDVDQLLRSFLWVIANELGSTDHPVAVEAGRLLESALEEEPPGRNTREAPETIGAVSVLPMLPAHPLTDSTRQLANHLHWTSSPRLDDRGELVGLASLDDLIELGGLRVGLMLVGPHSAYPEHRHDPSEAYLVLGGEAEWRAGGSTDYRHRTVGDVVVNNPNDIHGVRTSNSPTVAVWVQYDQVAR